MDTHVKKVSDISLTERINEAKEGDIPDLLKAIAETETESQRAYYIQKLSERFQIPKKAILRDLSSSSKRTELIPLAYFRGLVDLCTVGPEVAFLVKGIDELRIETFHEEEGKLYVPPDRESLPFTLPDEEEVFQYFSNDKDDSLFEAIQSYLNRFAYLLDKDNLIITASVFLTYLQDHPGVNYLPIILFYAVPERGKSRTGKAVSYIAFRGVHLVDLRESNLFRFSQNLKATLFFDIMDLWQKAERNQCEDILLLRFEKGAKVARVLYPERGPLKDTIFFDVFGPTFIASNEAVHKILDSRCIPIEMPYRPGLYEDPTPEKGRELKNRLTAWRARIMGRDLPAIQPIEGLQGRLWDISKPLLQVCKLVYPQGYQNMVEALASVANVRAEDRKGSSEGAIIRAISELSPNNNEVLEWTIKTSEILSELNADRPEGHKITPQFLGRKLRALGVPTRHVHGYSEVRLDVETLNALLHQYGYEKIAPHTVEKTLPNSTSLLNQELKPISAGRVMVESERSKDETLPAQTLELSQSLSLVESGRVSTHMRTPIFLSTLEVVE